MQANTYSKTDKSPLTKNFSITEFHCKGTNCGCKETLHDPQLSAYLQQIRDHFGKPVFITSGYRCAKQNAAVGGTAASRHMKGQAADFYIPDVEPRQIAQYAEQIGVLGIGLYGPEDGNFVHIDTRSAKSFWYGHKQEKRETFCNEAGIYVVTCQLGESPAHYTLIFDSQAGEATQRIGNSTAAVSVCYKNGAADFSTVSIGQDMAKILHIRKI